MPCLEAHPSKSVRVTCGPAAPKRKLIQELEKNPQRIAVGPLVVDVAVEMGDLPGTPELAAVHVGGALPVDRPVPLEGEDTELSSYTDQREDRRQLDITVLANICLDF